MNRFTVEYLVFYLAVQALSFGYCWMRWWPESTGKRHDMLALLTPSSYAQSTHKKKEQRLGWGIKRGWGRGVLDSVCSQICPYLRHVTARQPLELCHHGAHQIAEGVHHLPHLLLGQCHAVIYCCSSNIKKKQLYNRQSIVVQYLIKQKTKIIKKKNKTKCT